MKKGSNLAAAILMLLIVGIIMGAFVWVYYDQQAHLDRGCSPEAWNMYGQVSIWSCPTND
jgi:ABC-type antimicrobial peptide transport system permease subunit